MSLVTSVGISTSDCKNLTFRELTGVYNVTTNPNGWGSPNPLLSSATGCTLSITVPSGATYTFPNPSGFPTNDPTKQFLINYTSLGMSSGLDDGQYIINYIVVVIIGGIPIPFATTLNYYVTCNLKCCIDRMLTNIDNWDCDCNENSKENYLTAFSIYQQITHSIECGDITTANNNIKLASRLCANLDCITCK